MFFSFFIGDILHNMNAQNKNLIFHDVSQFSKTTFTDEGFLKTDAIITRAGVYQYKLNDGRVINQFRPPIEVFSDAAMTSMKMLPITNEHPPQKLVNSRTAKALSVGHLGETIVNENNRNMRATMLVTDSQTIEEIKAGKKQLSAGYTADLVEESGVFEGQPYTHVQKNIRGNHVAIVQNGRMGDVASITLDGSDAVQILINSEQEIMTQNFKTVLLDGIEYQASPEVLNAFDKIKNDHSLLQEEITKQKTMLDSMTAKCDALEKTNAELSARDNAKEIIEAAKARVSLLNTVKNVFGDAAMKKVETFNDSDIKREVLQPLYKDKDLKTQSDVYIDALFDATVVATRNSKIITQRQSMALGDAANTEANSTSAKALEEFNKRFGGK